MTLQILDEWYGERAIDYVEAWELQRELHAQRVDDEIADTALLLEHPPVYTAGSAPSPTSGRSTAPRSSTSTAAARSPSTALASSSATRSPSCPSHVLVVDYVRRLEEALIRACADLGVADRPGPGRSGVWLAAAAAGASSARSPPWASGSRVASRCTASRSTATSTWRLRPVRALRHRRRRSHVLASELGAPVARRGGRRLPWSRTCATLLDWQAYEPLR